MNPEIGTARTPHAVFAGHDGVILACNPDTCLNCGTRLLGDYCHGCGQSRHIHRTLKAWWHDLGHGVLHIEGAVWRTLLLLLCAPGTLSRRYIDGERRRFLAPLPMYLFAVFLLYVVFALFGGVGHVDRLFEASRAGSSAALARLDAQIARSEAAPAHDPEVAAHIADLRRDRADLLRGQSLISPGRLSDLAARQLDAHQTGWKALDAGLQRAIRDPDFLIFKLEANGYKFSWLLIPLSLPLMWLLFAFRRDVVVFDHAVFVTYSLSFVSLLATVIVLSGAARLPHTGWLAWLMLPHVFLQLRGTYRLGLLGTIWRMPPVLGVAGLALVGWILLLLTLGVLE